MSLRAVADANSRIAASMTAVPGRAPLGLVYPREFRIIRYVRIIVSCLLILFLTMYIPNRGMSQPWLNPLPPIFAFIWIQVMTTKLTFRKDSITLSKWGRERSVQTSDVRGWRFVTNGQVGGYIVDVRAGKSLEISQFIENSIEIHRYLNHIVTSTQGPE
jgi:hypothetical protein